MNNKRLNVYTSAIVEYSHKTLIDMKNKEIRKENRLSFNIFRRYRKRKKTARLPEREEKKFVENISVAGLNKLKKRIKIAYKG